MDKFLIIDGNSIVYRAYYALPFLANSKGQYTGAIYGFLNMLLKALEMYNPTHIAIAFDFSKYTFRNKLFSGYKQTRKKTPKELIDQIQILKEILISMGIVCIEKEGIEGDDIIGTLAKQNNCDKVILSGDRDVLQLIDDKTCVWLTKQGLSKIQKINENILMRDFKLEPAQVIDLKGLMGDSSDNIPGIKGIGQKTATALIEQFSTLEEIYKNLDNPNITTNVRNKLIGQEDIAFLSKQLATIKIDCEFNYEFDKLKLILPFSPNCISLLQKYEFNTLLKRNIFDLKNEKLKKQSVNIEEIKDYETIKKICDNFLNQIQPNNLKQDDENIKSLNLEFAFSLEKDIIFSFNQDTVYIIKNEINLFSNELDIQECISILKPCFENENINKIVSDLKLCKHILNGFNVDIKGDLFDLKLASYLIGGSGVKDIKVESYFSLKKEFIQLLEKNNMVVLYKQIEIPLVNVLFDMEKSGFKVDIDELNKLSEKYDLELQMLTKEIYELAGKEFNINSPKQLADILFVKLGLNCVNNKKQSTGFEYLTQIEEEHKIVSSVLRYRKIQKLKGTYIDSYKKIVSPQNSVIHTVFNQMLTSTGRLSSSEPNLQNIPIKDDEGKGLRKVFISRFEKGLIVSADYNQIELRLLAHCSEDEKLINAFNNNKDIHSLTASQIFGINEEDVTPAQRREAKAVNFGIIYGISDFGLSQNVGITRKSAKEYIDKYFNTYPKVKEFMDNNVRMAKKDGQIGTIFNRIRRIPEINSSVYSERMFGERVAMNMPLQGSASDIIKIAMINVNKAFKEQNLKSKLVLQIHDELIVDAEHSEINIVENILKKCMENVISLKVPLVVEITSGKTWMDCK
ncbi:MAG: DNA polymerase I [Clostridia bacterium]|nr:DNA polymerase I [Clostridia bacterium]